MLNVRESIADLLKEEQKLNPNIPAHLFELTSEVQVMMDTEGCEHPKDENGKKIEGQWLRKNSKGEEEKIWNIRIPKGAEYRDKVLEWSLAEHAKCIGISGWDWKLKVSRHVGFDIDLATETAHRDSGITAEQLSNLRSALEQVPWIELRKSTGGGGLHARVHVANIPTENHFDHARLGKYVRKMIGEAVGFDVSDFIDTTGTVLWIWSRRTTEENEGFKLITGREPELLEIPDNWRELIPVERKLAGTSRGNPVVALDAGHDVLVDWLRDHGWVAVLDEYEGRPMLRTHTKGLAEAFAALKLPGVFETNSAGTDGASPNCYCFPKRDGRWIVHRYSAAKELPSWTHSDTDTWCYFGVPMNLEQAAQRLEVVAGLDGYTFDNIEQASQAAKLTGYSLTLPEGWHDRQVTMGVERGVIVAYIDRYTVKGNADASDPANTGSKCPWKVKGKNNWSCLIGRERGPDSVREASDDDSSEKADDYVRHVHLNGEEAGWYAKIEGRWIKETKENCQLLLGFHGLDSDEVRKALFNGVGRAWELVDKPFHPQGEYPGRLEWNLFGAGFAVEPVQGDCSHFLMVLDHCGQYLTKYVREDEWCQRHGIGTGGQYLLHWLACKIQNPGQSLPYLFMYGPQNAGKSSFYKMMKLVINRGIRFVDKAFKRQSTFNAEFAGTLIAVIEEAALTDNPEAVYNSIKQLVTEDEIAIELKGKDAVNMPNRMGFIHDSNSWYAVPITDKDDTRIVAIEVFPFDGKHIESGLMMKHWQREAGAFLRLLLDLPLPNDQDHGDSRCFLPVLMTPLKQRIIDHYAEQSDKDSDERFYHNEAARLAPAVATVAGGCRGERLRMSALHQAMIDAGADKVPDVRHLGRVVELMGGKLQDAGFHLEHGEDNRGSWVRFNPVHQMN